jgi:hypothetical protein
VSAAKKITVDDLRDKAEEIRDTIQEDARRVFYEDTTKLVIVGAVVVATVVSLAFYLGTRRCRF